MHKTFTENNIVFICVSPRLTYRLYSFLSHEKRLSVIGKITGNFLFYILNKIKLVLTVHSWPHISKAYTKRIEKLAYEVCCIHDIDIIVPIYSQIDPLIVADSIKKKLPSLKYIPYFLDSLSGGYGPKLFSKKLIITRGLKWERLLLQNADKVVIMKSSEAHHRLYSSSESYYKNFVVLDIPLLFNNLTCKSPHKLLTNNMINLVYVGSLPAKIRSPHYLLNTFMAINNANWNLYFIGDESCTIVNEFAKKNNHIHVIGRCNHDTIIQYEKEATALINIGNSNPNMVPSKIFEYMSLGKPIISTMPIKTEPSAAYLNKYPCSLLIYEDQSNYAESAQLIEDFIKNNNKCAIDLNKLLVDFYANTPAAFADSMEKI